jgi:hypothetical protein
MTETLIGNLTDVANGQFGQYFASPLEAADSSTRVGALKTGGATNKHLRFGVVCNPDDRKIQFMGAGLAPADPIKAPLFILRRFSSSGTGFNGVAFRQSPTGGVTIQLVHDLPSAGDFQAPADVLEKLLERGIASTAYLGALGLFTNLCDGGLDQELARQIARDAFELYMPLFAQYGVAEFFESDGSGSDGD